MKKDPEIVHKTMSAIRGKDTGIEKKLRKALTDKGLSYRLYSNKVPGHPDILFPQYRIAIFADSEFWHGYHFEENLQNNPNLDDWWIAKIRRNIARDEEVNRALKKLGYVVLRFWGEQINKDIDKVVGNILSSIESQKKYLANTTIAEKTTMAYIVSKDRSSYLLLHRNKEKNDINEGKWIGIGGHLEEGETYLRAFKREIKEEASLEVKEYRYLGYADFLNDLYPSERMYIFRVDEYEGEVGECDEGELSWVEKKKMLDLPMWEGDKAFIPYIESDEKPFSMILFYHGDELLGVDGPHFPNKKKKKKGK